MSGLVMSFKFRPGRFRSSQARSGFVKVRLCKVRGGQVMSGQPKSTHETVSSGQLRACDDKSGQDV